MNKQIRLISALAFGMIILSISTLANAEVILNVTEATLVAKGAGVDVSLQVTCNPSFGDNSGISMSGMLTQRTGNSTTNASMSFSDKLNCNGNAQNLDILAAVINSGKPFKKGPAFINISALVNGPTCCQQFEFGSLQQEIDIK